MTPFADRPTALLRPLLLAAGMVLLTSTSAWAQSATPATPVVEEPAPDASPAAAAMAFDLIVVRPLSLVATVIGSGLFLLQLPLALIQAEPPTAAAEKLVVEPARYTFDRPLGVMD
ncbi:hypothetical protein SAMN04488068_0830 [Hydrocarboniphaga daqingensis]|uniref:Multidrug transporter n=1 Tax=Hydrocarboniphaga daqingensis TaxID=490188 RepID=A0A1M5LCW7_9GAMM|nr:hypothetical protein [Hydrocarboniphaga daqingensis]SHG62867.1 hypothetical protein SAMN04488068_0830 [Hydrocarboniphaga daqingensis]